MAQAFQLAQAGSAGIGFKFFECLRCDSAEIGEVSQAKAARFTVRTQALAEMQIGSVVSAERWVQERVIRGLGVSHLLFGFLIPLATGA
jgi:hypothetical protein